MRNVKKVVRPLTKEFKRKNCGFDHTPPDDFVKSQWQNRTKSLLYLCYRWLVALFFIGVVIETIVSNLDGRYYLIYLTNWGILMCMATNLLGALLVTAWHYHPEYADRIVDSNSMPKLFKIYWGMHITTLIFSIIITIVYWSLIYKDVSRLTATSILTHAFNAILMFLDLLIVAYPVRMLHIFLPLSFGIIYVIFTVIYFACGGLDPHGNPYIYTVLDWTQPSRSTITVFGILTFSCFLYFVIFWIYKLRVLIYKRFNRAKLYIETVSPPLTVSKCASPVGISTVFGNYNTGKDNQGFTFTDEKNLS